MGLRYAALGGAETHETLGRSAMTIPRMLLLILAFALALAALGGLVVAEASPQVITSLIVIVVVMHILLIFGPVYGILLERKVAAWAQDRVGPNRVGLGMLIRRVINIVLLVPFAILQLFGYRSSFDPDRMWQGKRGQWLSNCHFWGLGQPLADGVKFLFKEDYNPGSVDRGLFLAAPCLAVIPAVLAWAVVPWGGVWNSPWGPLSISVVDVNIGVIYILAIGSLGVYGIAIGSWAANNKYTFLGGLRGVAQILSYEIPMGLCVLCVILLVGTASASGIVEAQADYWMHGFVPHWFIFQHPIVAVLFFTCVLAETNRAPFDLAEAEQELIGGFHTEDSSMKFAMFFLGEYMHMATGAAFFTLLFLGGWHVPYLDHIFPAMGTAAGGILAVIVKLHVFVIKVLLLVGFMMHIRWTLPRFRFDQLMRLAWRGMIPLSLGLLLTTGTFVYLGWTDYVFIANVLVYAVAMGVMPYLPSDNVNRRVPLEGSRFSPVVQ